MIAADVSIPWKWKSNYTKKDLVTNRANIEHMNYGKLEFQYVYWINTSLSGIKSLLIKHAFSTGDCYACNDSVSFSLSLIDLGSPYY